MGWREDDGGRAAVCSAAVVEDGYIMGECMEPAEERTGAAGDVVSVSRGGRSGVVAMALSRSRLARPFAASASADGRRTLSQLS